MALLPGSYGSVQQVASLAVIWTTDGAFDADSNPTLAKVETWIDQVSAALNISLAGAGFTVPVTNANVVVALGSMVDEAVAELVKYANNAGRFSTERALKNGASPMTAIRNDLAAWVKENADALELSGATRTRAGTAGILSRGQDRSGNDINPIFQRNAFGNRFKNWDGG